MIADIIAEALAAAGGAVPQSIGRMHDQYVIIDKDRDIDDSGWGLAMMAQKQHVSARKPRVIYVRHDAMLAALRYLAERLERVEVQLEAASREGWRACVLLAAAQEQIEADRIYAEADRVFADGAGESAIEELHEQAGASDDEARRLRACAMADATKEVGS